MPIAHTVELIDFLNLNTVRKVKDTLVNPPKFAEVVHMQAAFDLIIR
jgi:hypothetical protein